jgi:hypothetical protein
MESVGLQNLVACFHFRPQGKPTHPGIRLEPSWNSAKTGRLAEGTLNDTMDIFRNANPKSPVLPQIELEYSNL